MADIDNLSIAISSNAENAINSLNQLISAFGRLNTSIGEANTALQGTNSAENNAGIERLATTIDNMRNNTEAARTSAIRYAAALTAIQTRIEGLTGIADNFNLQLPDLNNNAQNGLADNGFTDGANEAAEAANALDQGMENIAEGAQTARNRLRPLANTLGNLRENTANALPNLRTFASQAKSLGNLAFSPVINSFKSLGKAAKSAYSSVTGLFSQITRIAFYRVIRTAIKEISKGLTEGMKNMYHYSETFNGTFYKSMNQIATSANYVKNSLGAMVAPLITAVTPVITSIADKLVDVFNLVNQFIARLTGQSTYTAAKKVASIWDEESKKTAKSTKDANDKTKKSTKDTADDIADTVKKTAQEIQRYTLGFDELNILGKNKNDDSGDDGISGKLASIVDPTDTSKTDSSKDKTGTDYGSMFETRKISGAVSNFADAIRKAFLLQDWESLGTLIGNKINSTINSVNWEGLGSKLGSYLNGAIETAYYLLSAIDFVNIGSRIAEFLNGAIDSINFNTLGRLMVKKLTIIPDMIIGFFVGFDWGQAASKLSDFVNGCFEEMTKWFKSYSWTDLGKIVAGKLIDAITNIQYYSIAKNFFFMMDAALEAASGMLAGFFDGLAAKFKAIVNWDSMSNDVKNAVTAVMGLVGIAVGAVGAILTFSGVNPAIGIPMMIAGGFAAGTAASLKWDGLSDKMETVLKIVKSVVYPASFVIGCVLAFSGANIPLGLGMMAMGAAGTYKTAKENWDEIYNKLRGPIGAAEALVSGAMLTIGVLAIIGGSYAVGIGAIIAGAAGLALNATVNWDRLRQCMEGPIGELTAKLSAASLILGFAVLAGGFIPLGIGLIVAGAAGLAATVNVHWNRLQEYMEGPVGELTAKLSGAALVLGFVSIAAGFVMLGVGLIVMGSMGLAASLPTQWDRLQKYMEGPIGELTLKLSAASLVLGFVAFAAGFIMVGVGLLALGAIGIATALPANWKRLQECMEGPLGELTKILSGMFLVLGLIALAGGNIPLGVGLILAGAAGLVASKDADFTSLKQFGIDAANAVKSGWDSIIGEGLTLNGGVKAHASDWSPKFESSTETLERYIENLGKGVDLDIRVSLVKDAWTSVADWATNTGVDVNAKVALVKASWDTVSEWANRYIGMKINQSVGLERSGWTVLSKWVEKFKDPRAVDQIVGLVKSGWSTVSSWVDRSKGGTVEQGINLSVKNWNGFLGGISSTLHNWFPSIFAEGGAIEHGKVSRFAGGGIINAYAGGTSSAHGSLFLAGEAGPEIVGHVGGRTEVLNRSQLAATMYAAVNAAMAPAAANFASAAAYMYQGASDYGDDDMDMLLQLVRAGSEATERQNELLRQQNDYLRQISTKELVTEISTADINRAQARSNRRAGTTIVPATT